MADWREILKQHDIAPRYTRRSFAEHPATKDRWKEITEWVMDPQGNVVMFGSCGNGKTHTAIAILAAYSHRYGIGARFFNAETLFPQWLAASKEGQAGDFSRRLSDAPLLILDDLGQGDISEGFKRFVYGVINRRWEWERPTVITTNRSSKEFRDIFGDQILSRIMDGKVWQFDGEDNRVARGKRLTQGE